VVAEVFGFLGERARFAEAGGVDRGNICLDPGIGFGKTLEHNLLLLHSLDQLCALGYPVLIGVSRKRFIGAVTGEQGARLNGTVAANVLALSRGASLFRVHDVRPNREALDLAAAVLGAVA
jgi:dihydropteroate synthase